MGVRSHFFIFVKFISLTAYSREYAEIFFYNVKVLTTGQKVLKW